MKEQFVTYEIALKLKELGFNEECLCTYSLKDKSMHRNPSEDMLGYPRYDEPLYWKNSEIHESVFAAPLWQQVIDWLREKHEIVIYIRWNSEYKPISWEWVIEYKNGGETECKKGWTHQEAREQAILKALELCKNN